VEFTRALRAGKEEAWREFHAAYAPRLLRYLFVVCGGQEEAAREALQNTLLRAVKHMRAFSTEAELWGWLTLLARCAAADAGRRERRYLGFLQRWFRQQPDAPDEAAGVEAQTEASELEAELEESLAAELALLPADERGLLERKYFAGTSVRELAGELGVSEKAAESRLMRARQKLREALLARVQKQNQEIS